MRSGPALVSTRLAAGSSGGQDVPDFVGTKLALLHGTDVLTYLRDDLTAISWPARWDLPGGGREGRESPQSCVLRELEEEFGLRFGPERLILAQEVVSMTTPGRQAWVFAGHITEDEITSIRFGEEGQFWKMMPLAQFLVHPQGIPPLQDRFRALLGGAGWLEPGGSAA